ncbi:MOSC domain-containing protein [Vibrio sp. OCN044]|uniref:MOSC domain-containing protein n=1 Tax=Vibrio tetraodonis subsp. pristinus TaxID=2695891 RepID=A0A6L8LRA9_9VIBR|nr:MOSC domain-containing protein [Vibrio tetraodonis]MYM58624.1 MOSC domain-containing protein [Vibrio tetraodonis subsp. pristinus]
MKSVVSVSKSAEHTFSKSVEESILLIEGEGVEGDAHRGKTVKHRSRVKVDPTQPNLRQIHLLHSELFHYLAAMGFDVGPACLGENITTLGIDLLALPKNSVLKFSGGAEVLVTGLRNPCPQIEEYQTGLLSEVLGRDDSGKVVRKAGIMGVVKAGGWVSPGDSIEVELPPKPYEPLQRV